MNEVYARTGALPTAERWPPDDTEESVVGTDLHQTNIINLRWGINEIAGALAVPGQPTPWQALSQTVITGFQRRDGSRYKTLPDVFVYKRAIDRRRRSLSAILDGAPVLIIEVLSDSTYDVDLDLEQGKGYSYARAGVREYLALDPTGEFLPELGRGWHLREGAYQPWNPDELGRWHSEEIAVTVGIEGLLATVYTRDGRRQLREGEVTGALARAETNARALARAQDEVEELRRLVEQLRHQQ